MYRLRSLKIQETTKIDAVASAALLKSKADLLISQCHNICKQDSINTSVSADRYFFLKIKLLHTKQNKLLIN